MVLSQKVPHKEDLMYSFFEKGYDYIYVQKDSAYHHLEKALDIAHEIGDNDSRLGILDHIAITADYHHDLVKFRAAIRKMDIILSDVDIAKNIQGAEDWQIAYLMWLAIYHFETMDFVEAKERFIEARNRFEKIPLENLSAEKAQRLYNLNSSLGTTYRNLGEYELADLNYRRCIELVTRSEALQDNADHYLIGVQQSLAQLYTQMGRYGEANSIFLENLDWSRERYREDRRFKNNVANAYQQLTLNYIAQDSLEKALFVLKESQAYLLDDDPFYKDALLLYGDIYSGLHQNQKAMDSYQKALSVFREFRENKPHQDVAKVHGRIAEFHLAQDDFEAGLQAIRKAFNSSGRKVLVSTDLQNPDPEAVFSKKQLLELLDIKLRLLQAAYEQTGETVFQNSAMRTNESILNTFDRLKAEFDSKLDKQFLAEEAYPIFHRMLEVAHTTHEKKPSTETLQLALNIAEKNKDFLLLEALRNAQATTFGDVPQQILNRASRLRAQITHREKEIFDAKTSDPGFSDGLFHLKQQYYGLLDTIQKKHPKYHNLKYRNALLDLPSVYEKLLDDGGTLISYTLAENHLYAIVLGGEAERFLKLPFSEADRKEIREFYGMLSRPTLQNSQDTISALGASLYDKVLRKSLEGMETGKLTIISDGELHYLPFDLLQKDGAMLLESYAIGYANSLVSLMELTDKNKSGTNRVLAFAPKFTGKVAAKADRQFGKLLYNSEEVTGISPFFETRSVTEEGATLSYFSNQAPDFNILHLATHASANDEFPDYSYLAFSETADSSQNNILYVKDLYDTSLNADMVTLSACQTGIGKLQKGQGVLSLSKGFYYAGARSLVNTLWKINDKSTVPLMEYFYKGLSEGKSKSEALRDAKMTYLEKTDDDLLRHPYYWAAFVVSGDVSPLTETRYWWYIGAALLFFAVLFVVWRINRGKNNIWAFKV